MVGVDPLGPTLLLKAITDGASRARIVAFTGSVFVTLVAMGTLVAWATRTMLDVSLDPSFERDAVWALITALLAVALVVWVVRSFRKQRRKGGATRPEEPRRTSRSLEGSAARFAGAGILFGLSAVLDPTLLAAAALLGATENLVLAFLGMTLWTLVSEALLFALFFAYLAGRHEWLVEAIRTTRERHGRTLRKLAYVLALLIALLFALNSVLYVLGIG